MMTRTTDQAPRSRVGRSLDDTSGGTEWSARHSNAHLATTAIVTGLLLGPLDLVGQVHAPYPFAHLFNSPAIWAVVAFVVGRSTPDMKRGIAASIAAMMIAVEGYYLADVLARGANTSNLWSPVAAAWLLLGVGAGTVFGAAGVLSTASTTWTTAGASAILPSVFAAEAIHSLISATTIPVDARSDDLGQLALLLGLLAVFSALWLLARSSSAVRLRALECTVAMTTFGVGAFQVVT